MVEPIVIPPCDDSANANRHEFDLTTGRSQNPTSRKMNQKNIPSGEFPVKIQVPLDLRTHKAIPGGTMRIYNEGMHFDRDVSPHQVDATTYQRLFQFVTQSGIMGLKVYANAYVSNGALHITPTALPLQSW
jgi:hypothetical protein